MNGQAGKLKAIALITILLASTVSIPFIVNDFKEKYDLKNTSAAWIDTSWKYSKKIIIDHTKVSATLTNFPVLVSDVSGDYWLAQASGNDFCFYNSDNTTKYNHEIEKFDRTTGTLVAWVNVTSLSSSTDTVIWMYYGNPAAANQQNVVGTWNSNYIGVYHMKEASGATCYDSSSKKINGTIVNTPTLSATGKMGPCYNFAQSSSQYVNFGNVSSWNALSAITLEAWCKPTTWSDNNQIWTKQGVWKIVDANPYYYFTVSLNTGDKFAGLDVDPASSTWWNLVGTWRTSDGQHIFYINGSIDKNITSTGTMLSGETGYNSYAGIAATYWHNNWVDYYDGLIDEVRISKIARNGSWITTEYNNQNSPSTFMSIKSQRSRTSSTWYDSNWHHSKKIVIDHTKVAATLTNFPVLINTTSLDYQLAQSSGNDFVFLNATNQTKYNHEIEYFSKSTGALTAWVNITSLSSTVDTVIWMYYDNPTCINQQNVYGTWNSHYKMVLHMNGASYSTTIDSTSNRNDITAQSGSPTYQQTGKVGYAVAFSSAGSTYINTNNPVRTTFPMTVEAWIKPNPSGYFMDNGAESGHPGFTGMMGGSPTRLYGAFVNAVVNYRTSDYFNPQAPTVSGVWYYWAIRWTGDSAVNQQGNRNKTIYYKTPFTVTAGAAGTVLYLGRNYGSSSSAYMYTGTLDEIRISDCVWNNSWINATYDNMYSPSTFESLGAQRGSPYGVTWYNNDWKYSKKIVIDHTKISANLTNFPVLYYNVSTDLKHALSNGYDFIFVDSTNSSKYNHEIESFDSATGTLVAWINVTRLSKTIDTTIWMYYGNPSAANQQNKAGTWDSNYVGVWHMNDATTSTVSDSTASNNLGTKLSANNPLESTSGKMARCQDFSSDYVQKASGFVNPPVDAGTYECWFNKDSYVLNAGLIELGSSNDRNVFYTSADGTLSLYLSNLGNGGGNRQYYTRAYTTGVWYHAVAVFKYSTDVYEIYVNGVASGNVPVAQGGTPAFTYAIWGSQAGPSGYFDGRIDEMRVSNSVRNASWINTSYLNQNSPSTFETTGNEKTNWYNTSFLYRMKITINHNKVDADQTNFPVLIKKTMTTSKVQSNANDILFTSSTGTKLNHEIESYNSTSGALVAWVNVTSVSSAAPDTYIYMYYGNATCSSQQNKYGTWNSNYKMVQHMKDTTTSTITDSTSNKNNGTKTSANHPIQIGAKMGNGQDFTPNDVIDIADSTSLSAIGASTYSLWYANTETNYKFWFGKDTYPTTQEFLVYLYTAGGYTYAYFNYESVSVSNALEASCAINVNGNWHHLVATYDGTNAVSHIIIYLDGVSQTLFSNVKYGTGYTPYDSTAKFTIGGARTTYHDGTIDEFRVSNIARSSTWISTEYKNQNDPANFTIFSTEESNGPTGPTNHAPNTSTGLAPSARQITTSVNVYAIGSDPDGGSLSLYFYNNGDKTEIGHTTISNNTNGSVSWSGLSRGNTYTFYARVYDGTTWGSNSSTCSFIVNSIPVATGFMIQNLTDPLHITTMVPYYNWTTSDGNGDTQVAYDIEVGTTNSSNNIWDSGTVTSSLQHAIYAGPALSRGTLYYVRVKVYDGYEWSSW